MSECFQTGHRSGDGLGARNGHFLYEEALGTSDRIHWLIHTESLASYYSLIDMRAWTEDDVRDVYSKEWIAAEKGGGTWDRMFIDATLIDLALTPQHWGM
ncbi:DUF6039 family protein [Streptomyces sp. M92]|uniref:DUF6039 family protein n=1 Tax=Streptomyces sp. M92 TaxID=2944250 RepID=UPI002349C578|nr:DUF6039 family protein [Streptomyces sp. M92]WCN04119.1 DUF6039 family protein [Streptomyces sp. M92]